MKFIINANEAPDEDSIIKLDANYGKVIFTNVPWNSNNEPFELDENENDFNKSPENESKSIVPSENKK